MLGIIYAIGRINFFPLHFRLRHLKTTAIRIEKQVQKQNIFYIYMSSPQESSKNWDVDEKDVEKEKEITTTAAAAQLQKKETYEHEAEKRRAE